MPNGTDRTDADADSARFTLTKMLARYILHQVLTQYFTHWGINLQIPWVWVNRATTRLAVANGSKVHGSSQH